MAKKKLPFSKWAKRGYDVAFRYKENARKYKAALRKEGYRKSSHLRSRGPTIDAPSKGRVKAYYVMPGTKKKITPKTKARIKKIRKTTFIGSRMKFRL